MILPLLTEDLVYVASYFTGNGESGARFAISEDGFAWKNAGSVAVPPTVGGSKIVRDPCFFSGPKEEWNMVYTTDWWSRDLGHARLTSTGWSAPNLLAGLGPENAKNVWAPEAVWDAKAKNYLIYWSSTIPGAFPETIVPGDDNNHRFYSTTTKDFKSFSPTRLLWNPGFNVIDATIIPYKKRWLMIAKDERKAPVVKKSLFAATAPTPQGPWTIVSTDLGNRSWIEGPTAVDLGDRVRVYFDVYTDHKWGALESSDLRTWSDVSDKVKMVPGARHGTIHRLPRSVAAKLTG